MKSFYPGDSVEVIERGKTRCFGRIVLRSYWSKDHEDYYLILPEGKKSLADAIAAFQREVRPLSQVVANENFRASESVM